ncbi:MAG: 50S ribosomal protein L6 [Patescibacteria group bacterium]|nr:MAG: 50S ribosomal protein L6 [Patescibacteria group bacterium]
MSRIGKLSIALPTGVSVTQANNVVKVTGPKGTMEQMISSRLIKVVVESGAVKVEREDNSREAKSLHGLYRTLVSNMVTGVSKGWVKELEVVGTGYRAALNGVNLQLSLGYSHPVVVSPYAGVSFQVQGNKISISGIDKQVVGQMAAEIRAKRKPDPYKGKGVRYAGEVLKLKAGKAKKAK